MSGSKLSHQDRKDLEKFTRFLIYKSLQIIVQSRLGEKIKTKSKPHNSGADWFNLAIKDIPDVHAETKKALSGQQSLLSQNVCVEISLKTSEGDTMILETWYIGLNSDICDTSARVSYTVYNRMGIALKSLFSVSRVTPAYKLSRRQGQCSEDYVICYKIYLGDPQFYMLGEGYQQAKVGNVPTPVGTISINVAYRTKLLITPQKTCKEVLFDVKDDHFKKDNSPKRPTTPKPCSLGYRRESVSDELNVFDGQELCSTTFSTSPADGVYNGQINQHKQSDPIKIAGQRSDNKEELQIQSAPEKQSSFTAFHRIGAFAQQKPFKDLKNGLDDVPFLNLLHPAKTDIVTNTQINKPQPIKNSTSTQSISESTGSISKSSSSQASAPDDFVMIELKTPFAGADPNSDLGKFYRECQNAPPLADCPDDTNITETLEQITDQISNFESNMKDFDEFVSSLAESLTD